MAAMFESMPSGRSKLHQGFLNDILIALSARSMGATVITQNVEDFRMIQQYKAFNLGPLEIS